MIVRIPSSLRALTSGQPVIEESAPTVGALVDRLDSRFPGFRDQVCEPDGRIKRFINVFVNGKVVRDAHDSLAELGEKDEVLFIPDMGGGAR